MGNTKIETLVTLVRAQGVGFAAEKGKALPTRVKFLSWGENPNAHGRRVHLGRKALEALGAPTYPYRRVALDYEHNTLPGTPAYKAGQEPRTVAGFGVVEIVEGEGAFLSIDRYTPDGEQNAPNYCDLSAGAYLDEGGEVVAIHSVALCRNGAVEGMDFTQVALSVEMPEAPCKKVEEHMDIKKMAALLGLPETATEAEIETAVKALKAAKPEPGKKGDKPEPDKKGEKPEGLNADGTSTGGQPAALDYDAITNELDKRQQVRAATAAGKDVKLSPAALSAMTPAEVGTYIAGLAVTVPVKPKTPDHIPPTQTDPQNPVALSAEEIEIYNNCGAALPEAPKK